MPLSSRVGRRGRGTTVLLCESSAPLAKRRHFPHRLPAAASLGGWTSQSTRRRLSAARSRTRPEEGVKRVPKSRASACRTWSHVKVSVDASHAIDALRFGSSSHGSSVSISVSTMRSGQSSESTLSSSLSSSFCAKTEYPNHHRRQNAQPYPRCTLLQASHTGHAIHCRQTHEASHPIRERAGHARRRASGSSAEVTVRNKWRRSGMDA